MGSSIAYLWDHYDDFDEHDEEELQILFVRTSSYDPCGNVSFWTILIILSALKIHAWPHVIWIYKLMRGGLRRNCTKYVTGNLRFVSVAQWEEVVSGMIQWDMKARNTMNVVIHDRVCFFQHQRMYHQRHYTIEELMTSFTRYTEEVLVDYYDIFYSHFDVYHKGLVSVRTMYELVISHSKSAFSKYVHTLIRWTWYRYIK